MDTLTVLLSGNEIGTVHKDKINNLSFRYREDWRSSPGAIPLSVSMPLAAAEHGHSLIESFLWGLLPDNERVLDRWARRFQVSARNAFALIAHVGEDCAGAVQFIPPDRVDSLSSTVPPVIEWLSEAQVAERLRLLRADHSVWRMGNDVGQFSLAGAQPKTALLFDQRRWGVPAGRTPTTHILKPPTGDFAGHAENEHFCLALARAIGLPAAASRILSFDGEIAIVVERYDRLITARLAAAARAEAGKASALDALAKAQPVLRVHQEDMCQALGIMPTAKYQNDGGPSPGDIINLLRDYSSRPTEDIATFVDALIFNWLVAGTDAHAKNYSLLHGSSRRVRLAPLYDIASALPYDRLDPQRLKLAMKIGGKYRIRDIRARQWISLATENRLDADHLVSRVIGLAEHIANEASNIRNRMRDEGISHPIVDKLAHVLTERAESCATRLRTSPT